MAQIKFGRNYNLSVETSEGSFLTIELPFTIEFDIVKNTYTAANDFNIRIYNLSAKNRNLIRFDFSNTGTVRRVRLRAGYGDNLPIVFVGNIQQAWSVREGVDFITTITAFDGGDAYINGVIPDGTVFPANTPMETVYRTLMGYLPNTRFGAIGSSFIRDSNGQLIVTSRSNSYTGNTSTALDRISGRAFFIENGKSYILKDRECIKGSVTLIDGSTGLLNTPLRQLNNVVLEMMFEPGLSIGQLIELKSLLDPTFNSSTKRSLDNVDGFYKIIALKHRGMISESVAGDAVTTAEFYIGAEPLTLVPTT